MRRTTKLKYVCHFFEEHRNQTKTLLVLDFYPRAKKKNSSETTPGKGLIQQPILEKEIQFKPAVLDLKRLSSATPCPMQRGCIFNIYESSGLFSVKSRLKNCFLCLYPCSRSNVRQVIKHWSLLRQWSGRPGFYLRLRHTKDIKNGT